MVFREITFKYIIISVALITLTIQGFGQFSGSANYQSDVWKEFKEGQLHVVLPDDEKQKSILKDAIESNWTFNNVNYIKGEQLPELGKIESNYFLVPMSYSRELSGMDEHRKYLIIMRGLAKGRPELRSPLADFQIGKNFNDVASVNLVIRYLNWYCTDVYKGTISSASDFQKVQESNHVRIKEKPLYVLQTDLNDKLPSLAAIEEIYSGEIQVIPFSMLEKLILEKRDVNFFKSVSSDLSVGKKSYPEKRSYNSVINLKTGLIMFYDGRYNAKKQPKGLIPAYLKKWN